MISRRTCKHRLRAEAARAEGACGWLGLVAHKTSSKLWSG